MMAIVILTYKVLPFFVLLVLCEASGGGDSFEKETTVSQTEFAALEKFKERVLPKIPPTSLVKKFAADDLYMIRWLRVKNLDVNAAERMFLNHLKWREEQKIDTIDQEDFADLEREIPLFIDTFGKHGEPVFEYWFSEWRLRTAILAGKARRVSRWITRGFEMNSRRLYTARAEGKEVALAIALVDLDGLNFVEQICPACLPIYLNLMQLFESHYPAMYERAYFLNMHPAFDLVLRMLTPVMSRESRKAVKSFVNRADWMAELDKIIDKSERSERLGGTKIRDEL